MSRALLIGVEPSECDALRAGLREPAPVLELLRSPEEALGRLRAPKANVDAVVIGAQALEPLAAAEQVALADREMGVLLWLPPALLEETRGRMLLSPFIGKRASLLPTGSVQALGGELQRQISLTQQRRHHRRTLKALSEQMAQQPGAEARAAVLDSLLSLAPVGVLELDEETRVVSANPAAVRMLGPLGAATGRPLRQTFGASFESALAELESPGAKAAQTSRALLEHAGRFFDASLASVALSRGVLLVLHDVTEPVRLQREREVLVGELEAAVKLRDDFLSVASHELRTPLTAILGWVRLLRARSRDPEKVERGVEVIERNAKAQAKLIDDLLDVSRIVSGKLRLSESGTDLAAIVRQSLESLAPQAEARQVRLDVNISNDRFETWGDEQRLQQVLWNLLTNALKFTPAGGHIEVVLRRSGFDAELLVRDDGEGIEPGFLPHIFERFRQADVSMTRRQGGLGLGLAIVRHLVELHGGRVEVASEGRGKGATFTVTLPLRRAARVEPADPGAESGERAPDLSGLRVLVVEDAVDLRELLTETLEGLKVEVHVASSAAEARRVLRVVQPDVLICDIGLPDEDGRGLLRSIRALPAAEGGRVPAIALSALARPEDRSASLRAGFQMHLAKPVSVEELSWMLASLAGRT